MADAWGPGPQTTESANATRIGGIVVLVLAGISLAAGLMGWWAGGKANWRVLTTIVAIALGGLALVAGSQNRRAYYVLLGGSGALSLLSLGLGLAGWW